MSLEYEMYLKKHREAVLNGVGWFVEHIDPSTIDDIFPSLEINTVLENVINHDRSKYDIEEYDAYDNYFYRDGKNSPDGKMEFDLAFLHHIQNNPHHWQHWVLIDDGDEDNLGDDQIRALDMPDNYIMEMIADWWSFSWNKYYDALSEFLKAANANETTVITNDIYDNLYDIFDWYEQHTDSIAFSTTTQNKVNRFLDVLRYQLDRNKPESYSW